MSQIGGPEAFVNIAVFATRLCVSVAGVHLSAAPIGCRYAAALHRRSSASGCGGPCVGHSSGAV